jgi:hypothetical protein
MFHRHRVRVLLDLRDLVPPEVLIAAVIVKRQNAGQALSFGCIRRFEQDGFGARAIRELIGEPFGIEAIYDSAPLYGHGRRFRQIGGGKAFPDTRPRLLTPGIHVLELPGS